jgi:uncharacterized membrane protein
MRRVLMRDDEPLLLLAEESGSPLRATTDRRTGAILLGMTLSPRLRRAVLTAHIIASVGLLGDCAAIVAINIRAATTTDPELAASSYELLSMFGFIFGIPLSLASLATGVVLGLGSKWGVLRHTWVMAKLVVILSVIVVGALVIGPETEAMAAGRGGSEGVLILASVYDVVALGLATGLSVFKPGRRRRERSTRLTIRRSLGRRADAPAPSHHASGG